MLREALPSHFLPFCPCLAVVAVGINGQTASGKEFAPYLDILGIHELYEFLHYYVYAVLMEVSVVAESEKIQLQ